MISELFSNHKNIEIYVKDTVDEKGVSNVKKALWLETGDETKGSKPRLFLMISSQKMESDTIFLDYLISGQSQKAGQRAVEIVKEIMDTYAFEPLKSSTIKARKREGNYSIQPTTDKKSLYDSVDYREV
jgi:hypothetical protein